MKLKYLTLISLIFIQMIGCKGLPEYLFLPQSFKLDLTPFLFRVYSPAELATLSNTDFNLNDSGLITSTKFSRFLSNWSNNRPAGVSGNLVIFQVQTSGSSGRYVFFDGKQTFSYPIANLPEVLADTRDDGVLAVDGIVPKGKKITDLLTNYGIDPAIDYVVFAQDTSSLANLSSATFAYYTLLYWGYPKERLAVLNGSIADLTASNAIFTTPSYTYTNSNRGSGTKTLYRDHTVLQLTIGDLIHSIKNGNTNFEEVDPVPFEGFYIIDGRPNAAYTGTVNSTASGSKYTNCTTKTNSTFASNTCLVTFEGRIKSASNLVPTDLYDGTTFQFKSFSQLQTYLNNTGYQSGKQIYVYGEDATKGSLVWFILHQVLGKPTRLYEGGWKQYGALGLRTPSSGSSPSAISQPASYWRTDIATLSESNNINADANVPNYQLDVSRQFIKSANKIRSEDKAFLRGSSSGAAASGGGGAPTGGGGNACGG
ncbi:rhodanese-like domain-containing protein [Leptospira kanakyensis]|uniref:rhodanese-like domain-containing protein n=1 Tax=Leptospira kanakyensis TaxID=2484968 RepID=UPI00223E8871|nr:rhodanese-like domain-containing protein [Leptospira kanakyensis]MCW7468234.1 rhodanese-like domain-containing protein [Leptospira kanakyensis]MCW7482613.1 rhodanese-like domain-containing protein [Leptospira kanakyensis]